VLDTARVRARLDEIKRIEPAACDNLCRRYAGVGLIKVILAPLMAPCELSMTMPWRLPGNPEPDMQQAIKASAGYLNLGGCNNRRVIENSPPASSRCPWFGHTSTAESGRPVKPIIQGEQARLRAQCA
jgi:hypothetical protein